VRPECGDASACLKLRIPVIGRGHSPGLQLACQIRSARNFEQNAAIAA
jgi:hypothetical protein